MKRRQAGGGADDRRDHPWVAAGAVAFLTLLGVVIHVFGYSDRVLWSDEASTYWTIQVGLDDLLRGARTDGTPPLYFVIVALVTRLCGVSEVSLRLASIVPASLLVPAVFALVHRLATRRTAFIAAGLAALSPLVHYYSVEARNYALVQFETVMIVWAAWNGVRSPDRIRHWVTLALAHAVQLWTHNAGVFLLPVLPLTLLLAGGRARIRLALKASGAVLAAFVLSSPWLVLARQHAAAGIADWIVPYWEQTPPAAALLRSFEVLAFGGRYPEYLSYLGTAASLRPLAIPLTAVILLAALFSPRSRERHAESNVAPGPILLGFVALPLVGMWSFSLVAEPLYLVGRYDTIVLPIFLVVLAEGLEGLLSWRPTVGWGCVGAIAALAALTHATSLGQTVPDDPDVEAARVLSRQGGMGEPVVATGLRRPVVEYYLDRAHHPMSLLSYPAEVGEHPGWHSPARLLADPDKLADEAEKLAEALASEAPGRRVWLLASPRNQVDSSLLVALARRFVVDEQHTDRRFGLYCLAPARTLP